MYDFEHMERDKCTECGGKVEVVYFIDMDGILKPSHGVCTGCFKQFTVSG